MSELFTETEAPSLSERIREKTPEERAESLGRGLLMLLDDRKENSAFYDQAADRRTMKQMGVTTATHEQVQAYRDSRVTSRFRL